MDIRPREQAKEGTSIGGDVQPSDGEKETNQQPPVWNETEENCHETAKKREDRFIWTHTRWKAIPNGLLRERKLLFDANEQRNSIRREVDTTAKYTVRWRWRWPTSKQTLNK